MGIKPIGEEPTQSNIQPVEEITISPEDITFKSNKLETFERVAGLEPVKGYSLVIKNQPNVDLFTFKDKAGWQIIDNVSKNKLPLRDFLSGDAGTKNEITEALSNSLNYYIKKEYNKKILEEIGFNFISGTTQPSTGVKVISNSKVDYTRNLVENNPRTLYIFTDNTDRTSGNNPNVEGWYAQKYGTGLSFGTINNPTTAVIRGKDNAYPISTMKWFYKNHNVTVDNARWKDTDINEFKKVIDDEINQIKEAWNSGNYDNIIIPSGDGFFDSRIAKITKERTPALYNYLQESWNNFEQSLTSTQPFTSVKEGVSELFDSNPELAKIGTQEEYSQYLDGIFPNSKVKDIVYHGSGEKIEQFKDEFKATQNATIFDSPEYDKLGFFFTTDKNAADTIYAWKFDKQGNGIKTQNINPSIVNVSNPQRTKFVTDLLDAKNIDKTKDGYIAEESSEDYYIETTTENGFTRELKPYEVIIVPKSEQIHILGNKQDIEGFKEFISTQPPTDNLNAPDGLPGIPRTSTDCQ
jgi:hypothetical protein